MARKLKKSVINSIPHLSENLNEEEKQRKLKQSVVESIPHLSDNLNNENYKRSLKQSAWDSDSNFDMKRYDDDEDIAPVRDDRTWFKKSEGNWWETILGSGTDVTEHGTAGFLGIGEKLLDAGATLGALMNRQSMMQAAESEMMFNAISGKKDDKVLDRYLGIQDEVEKGTAEFVEKDLYDEEEIAKAIISDNARKIGIDSERHSVFGEKSDELAMSAGQLGGQLLADTILPGSGMAVMGASAFGSEAESAFRNGATFDEAVLASTISAGAEMLTEKIGGVKFGGKTLTDAGFGWLSNKVTGKFAKALLSAGKIAADASAESVEEIISGYMSAWGQKLTYMDDKEIEELFSKEDALDAAIGGFVLGGTFGGIETAISGRDPASGLTKHEQSVVDKVVEDEIAQKEADGKTLTNREKSKIRESVVDLMEKGQIDIDTIESVLGGDTYKAYKETVDSEDALKNELAELRKMKSGDMNDLQTSRMNELKEMNLDDTTKRDGLRKNLDDMLSPMLKDSKLTESYRERERRGQAFEADLSKYTGKKREAVERAVKSGVLNNTYRSHELVDVLSEIEATKGISFDYTNNEKLKESGFAVEGVTVNGFANKSKGAVTLNVQSAKAWESVVGHEITHVLEGTDAYSELRNALYAYAESKGELEGRRAYLTELYQNMDADVEAELTADLVGDYLFTDKDFVSKLTGNRTLFQKIYDEIKYLWNVATGKEKTEIEKVKAEFDRVWKEYSNNNETIEESSESREYGDADVQYSIREEAPPKETGVAYKVFFVKDGKLYPPMVANPDGADTPMGVWLNADVGTAAPPSKTGRAQVKAGGKGTQGGSGSLAFRPGWHLGDLPRASQFDRVNPETGKKELFPENFVWAEVEYAKDVDYQEEAMSYGYTDNGKFRHAYAGLPRLPENGYYRYRTNPKPDTVPWVITGAMKVNRLLSDAEVNEILEKNGVPAVHRKGGDVGLDKFGFDEKGQVQYSISTADKAFEDALFNGETETAQKMLDAAAKKAGYKKAVYHGTSADFTVFDTDEDSTSREVHAWSADYPDGTIFVAEDESVAYHYGNKVMPLYLDTRGMKTFVHKDMPAHRAMDDIHGYEVYNYPVIAVKGNDMTIYATLDNTRLKSAELVTTDDDGVIIPLSQRFNTSDPDIRFSLSSDSEGKTLYTGSPNTNIQQFKVGGVDGSKRSGDRYGRGVYLTTNENTAKGYAGDSGKVYEINADNLNIFNLNDPITEEMKATLQRELNGKDKQFRNSVLRNFRSEKAFTDFESAEQFFDEQRKLWKEEDGYYAANKPDIKSANDKTGEAVIEYTDFANIDNAIGDLTGNELYDALKSISTDDFASFITGHGFDGISFDEDADNQQYVIYRNEDRLNILNNDIAPTPDVQYSLSPETDADYMSAVERGDTETAQMMVDEAAKNAGYTRTLYHGTASKFNVFGFGRTGIFTTDNFDMAKTYGNNVMSLYGKEGANVLHIDAKESPHWAIEVSKDVLDFSEYPLMRGKERYSTNDISLIAFREGYDVVVIDNVYDNYSAASGNTENGLGTDVIYKDSNQVKSSEPVTYDDNGNVIPLSQRFNAENEDIRYSLSKEGEESAPVGTPLRELALDGDVAPVGENVARKTPKSVRIASGERSDELLYESLDNYPMQTVEQKIAEKLRATQGEIADNRDLRREAEANYEKQIANLRAKYNSKKNKNTKEASKILQSISRLERLKASVEADFAKRISDLEARAERLNDPKYARAMQKQVKMEADAKWAADLLGDTSTWKDKKIGLQYATNTERRNLRDIVRDANGNVDIAKADAIDDALNGQYNRDEAAKKKELAQVRGKYAKMNITKAEDAYIQMLGEFRHNPDTTLTEKDITEYYEKNKSKIDTAKVDRVIELARQDYDSWLNRVNAELKKQGMKEIPYRQGYFPHFTEPKQNFIQKLLNWKTQDNEIPTSIAGLTEQFKPTKSWQSFDKTRHSDETDYSFMKGFDSYSEGALDWIYHMDTLQKRRAVENHIRFTHSDEGIKARIKEVYANKEMDANEAQAQIEHILAEAKNPLNNFVQDFTTHTNILAGKKNSLDRTVEQWTNRHIYSVMTNVQNRMSANMVLANVRSALTNFIPITQSWAQVSPVRSLQAAKETIANSFKDDGTVDKSAFLTNRLREVDKLYQTGWDKVLDKAGIMFEIVDNFSSQVIWRSKYNQNLADGMTESEAIRNADQFAENVMAGRSKGNEPTLFNAKNPFVKAFTMFQLEVNNQYGYLFKDVPNDLKAETEHWKLNLAKGYTTAFIGAYVYNALLEQVTGSDAALDPIGIVEELLRDLGLFGDDEEEEPDKVVTNLIGNVAEELPFVGGLLGGGRIPISSAIPYNKEGLVGGVEAFADDAVKTFDAVGKTLKGDFDEADWSGAKNIGKEMMNPILNVLSPVAGGQIKKTRQGLNMFSDEHPVSGSYTTGGKLRFPVDDTPLNRLQAAVFGQYASKNAREYFDNDYAPLSEKQIQEYIDVDMPIKDYWEYREGLNDLAPLPGKKSVTLNQKGDYIGSLDLPTSKKNILINNIADRDTPIDMRRYDNYKNFEEFDFAQRFPEKYAVLRDQGISVEDYKKYHEESTFLYTDDYSWAADYPNKYTLSKVISDDVTEYKRYTSDLNEIKGENKKEDKRKYIFNLDIDYGAKCVLFKSQYKADDTYNYDIVNYINNRSDLSYDERVAILTELGFRVTADGQIYSD